MTPFAITNSILLRRRRLSCGLLLSLVCGTHAIADPITTGTFQGHGGTITFSAGTLGSLNYTLTSDTGDSWTGVFEIPDMNAQAGTNNPTVSVTNITAVNGGTTLSFVPNYYGSNSEGYVTWAGYSETFTSSFEMWSPGLRSVLAGGGTWNDLVSTGTFTFSTEPDNDSVFRVQAVVPEPSTCAMALAGIACGGFSMWRRRKRA